MFDYTCGKAAKEEKLGRIETLVKVASIQEYMEVWKKNGTTQYHRPPFLKSVKKEFRSARICELIFSNRIIFDLNKEIPYVPLDIMTEEKLIKWIYEFPSLVCNVDTMDRKKEVYIPEELAYGEREQGPDIKPFSILIFKVELLNVSN